ncbi:MAG: hypothetical protein E7172_06500 [Firmicutes bacterium]|nr:hypothetical protein [Bacillota bacterium]
MFKKNKYAVYTVLTIVNKTEVYARNESSAKKKIAELAEDTNLFSQIIPSISKTYEIKEVRLIEKNTDFTNFNKVNS